MPNNPSVPRYEDYFMPDGSPRPAPVPQRSVAQRAGSLMRQIPEALGALEALPQGRVVAAPVRGLSRLGGAVARRSTGGAAQARPIPNAVMSGPWAPPPPAAGGRLDDLYETVAVSSALAPSTARVVHGYRERTGRNRPTQPEQPETLRRGQR